MLRLKQNFATKKMKRKMLFLTYARHRIFSDIIIHILWGGESLILIDLLVFSLVFQIRYKKRFKVNHKSSQQRKIKKKNTLRHSKISIRKKIGKSSIQV